MRKSYLPGGDGARLGWLFNFSTKIGTYSVALGISALEVTAIGTYYTMFLYIMNLIEMVRTFSPDLTRYKETLMVAPPGSPLGAPPALTIPAAPPTVAAGIFTIISGFVKRIKGSASYTEAIGEDLGIIGSDFMEDFDTAKPQLKITLNAGKPEIKYRRNHTDGINLYADHDNGNGMVFIKFITKTTYEDATSLPPAVNSAVWKYKGIYVVDDTEVGIASDEVSVTVKKMP